MNKTNGEAGLVAAPPFVLFRFLTNHIPSILRLFLYSSVKTNLLIHLAKE